MTKEKLCKNLRMKPEEANELFSEETLQSMQTLAAGGGKQPASATNNPHSCPTHSCPVHSHDCAQTAGCTPQDGCVQAGCNQCGCGLATNHGCQLPFAPCVDEDLPRPHFSCPPDTQPNCTHFGCRNNHCTNNGPNCQIDPSQIGCTDWGCTNNDCGPPPTPPPTPTPTPCPTACPTAPPK